MKEDFNLDYKASVVNSGNQVRLKNLFRRAQNGEKLSLGFIGGSITQGSLATRPEYCYAYHVYEWWCKAFPNVEFNYINAGIGATDSQFGCARVYSDLLKWKPDFVIIEFSVNDLDNSHFMETYEGLVRKVYYHENSPAVLLVHNVYYEDGSNAQKVHAKIGKYYELPCISMLNSIYAEIQTGRLKKQDITQDGLHPNDYGHKMVASVITNYLQSVLTDIDISESEPKFSYKKPFTLNAYENSVRYQNDSIQPVLKGFSPDVELQEAITDIFKKGWKATEKGASVLFEVEGNCIGIQYRKTMKLPAPVAELILDGDEAHPFRLDANFNETWGDKMVLETVLEHAENKKHTVEIRLTETHKEDKLPFYLVSVIASNGKEQ